MPMYEYLCANCGKRFELIQKFADAPLTMHEECGGGPVERLISAPALQFKGTGWYVTDYAKGNGPASHADPKAKSESGKSESGKSDSGKSESGKSESSHSSSSSSSDSSSGSKSESGSKTNSSSTPSTPSSTSSKN